MGAVVAELLNYLLQLSPIPASIFHFPIALRQAELPWPSATHRGAEQSLLLPLPLCEMQLLEVVPRASLALELERQLLTRYHLLAERHLLQP
jgi:hypothetical protein